MSIQGILETALYVDDLAAAERFYRDVLKLELHSSDLQRHVFFRCGTGMLLLFSADVTSSESVLIGATPIPLHGARGAGHVAFRVRESELDPWKERLTLQGIPIEAEIEWPQRGRSIYFRDPSGNSLELATPRLWGLPGS